MDRENEEVRETREGGEGSREKQRETERHTDRERRVERGREIAFIIAIPFLH